MVNGVVKERSSADQSCQQSKRSKYERGPPQRGGGGILKKSEEIQNHLLSVSLAGWSFAQLELLCKYHLEFKVGYL